MKQVCLLLVCLVVVMMSAGCKSVSYFGKKYPPTQEVKVFYSEKDMPENAYSVMGRGVLSVNMRFTEGVVEKMCEKAKTVGADAVLIKGFIEIKKDGCSHGAGCQHNHPTRHELRAEFLKRK